ncbi:hypothetical protein [Streptomyces sp. NBC_00154]|uniref:hypothetical protein n=1 Tax=Streptomyces sp. NBC_00154 TaxID=2975670 RepID=UPI0022562E60|nr:hypothetical protein [Streptomyces sp. NBC_00154]MCX5316070.1 hypothetical protein [Streptomyces sp. NBC_00154]
MKRPGARVLACALALSATVAAATVSPAGADAPVHTAATSVRGGAVPDHFVGLSIEWSLVERYMNPTARPAFVNLLRNLHTGVLRIGGSSQDQMPFDATAPNNNRVITPEDLAYVRATLDAAGDGNDHGKPRWGAVLGTAMSPPTDTKPWVSPEHARNFITQGVGPAFPGEAAKEVAGIELGNEPDLSYGSNLDRYLGDLATYADPAVTGPYPVIAPNTSEDILPWTTLADPTAATRYFHSWPQILDTGAPLMKPRAGAFDAYASDHFYPLARTCTNKPYRCPSTTTLLSDEHLASLDYEVYTHATKAAEHGLGYRLEETNTAANRGADGVSNVAASATYALSLMFHTACPHPPDQPGANAACTTGAEGVNFHNAEIRAFFSPEEGNAYYNAVDYDPTEAMGAPTAAPLYYAILLFARFAQDTIGLHQADVTTVDAQERKPEAWQVETDSGEHRLFLINKADHPVTVTVSASGAAAEIDRMTPYDPDGNRTLDAPQVRIDGRQVAADGTWPGFRPAAVHTSGNHTTLTLSAGEAAVLTSPSRPREEAAADQLSRSMRTTATSSAKGPSV